MDATSGAVSPLMHELSAYIASAVDRAHQLHDGATSWAGGSTALIAFQHAG